MDRIARFQVVGGLVLLSLNSVAETGTARMYVAAELRQIPIERLARNLQKAMRDEPTNAQWVHNLARAHAMAWAVRSDSLPVRTGNRGGYDDPVSDASARRRSDSAATQARYVWFGYEPPIVPFREVASTADSARLRIARAHFDTAQMLYRQAVSLDSMDLVIRLGQAWLISQTADRAGAVLRLRSIMTDVNKPAESDRWFRRMGGISVRAEAAGYLIPLLDGARDRNEIASLRAQIAEEERRPRAVTPIAIPLQDGLTARDIEDRDASVMFDADGTGISRPWSWINANAAWLVYDPQHTGRVTSALQMFGSVSFWMFWSNGYDALASLDDNNDGEITGSELATLALWHDVNGNGRSDVGEVKPVSAYGIVALHCPSVRDEQHPDRIAYAPAGVTYADGSSRPTYDLQLHRMQRSTWMP